MDDRERALRRAAEIGLDYLAGLADRHVGARADAATIRERLPAELPEGPMDPVAVIEELAAAADPGVVASVGPRYFGFVVGGQLPASAAADWLTTAWGQNAVVHALSPAAAATEETAGAWMLELLGLPRDASVGLPTGAGLGNAIGLAAARHAVLAKESWDVEASGLYGAPEITVVIGEEAHATLLTALQYLGLGRDRVIRVATDDQGQMQTEAARTAIANVDGPLIVAAQAGNVNTGGFDPVGEIAVGARGSPERVAPRRRRIRALGRRLAATEAPRGRRRTRRLVVDRCPQVAERRLRLRLRRGPRPSRPPRRDVDDRLVPDAQRAARELGMGARQLAASSRLHPVRGDPLARARGHPGARRTVLRPGGRGWRIGCARPMASRCSMTSSSTRCSCASATTTRRTREVIEAVQADGTAWMGGTTWKGKAAMRISVSNWSTTEADADRTVDAILRAAAG